MKTILLKIGLITILAFLTLGCSQKTANIQTKEVISVKREVPMIGTLIGCSRQDIKNGFTENECGIFWGRPLDIIWGN